jgi:Txe/YoeB family toxin of toxin-antitoxin system
LGAQFSQVDTLSWSRRIDDEHRLVYRAGDKEVKILNACYHYGSD